MLDKALTVSLQKTFPDFTLSVSETFALAGVTAVFGPSGSGKTTLLRAIAGLDTPDSGHVRFGDEIWFDKDQSRSVPCHQRGVGYMFQDARLFSHLDVAGNLDFADKRSRSQAGRAISYTRDDIIESFALAPLLPRRIYGLSGGEQKRVALARTLLSRPQLLCLDEPLSGLDRVRKYEILPFLEGLPRRFGVPCFYVSHDIEEIMHLSDRTLILSAGQVQAYGNTLDVMQDIDVSPFTEGQDPQTIFEGIIAAHDTDQRMMVASLSEGLDIHMPERARLHEGSRVRLRIRARDVVLSTYLPEGLSIRNAWAGRIAALTLDPVSAFADIEVDLDASNGALPPLKVRITRTACHDLGLAEGMPLFALVKSVSFDSGLA